MKRIVLLILVVLSASLCISAQVWNRAGVVLYPSPNESMAYEPTLIALDSNPVILTSLSTVWKMWYSASGGVSYAESADGVTWTEYSAVVVSANVRPFVIKNSGTYYLYCSPNDTQIDEYTSTDGVSFTLAHAGVISGNMGGWNTSGLNNNSSGVIVDGTMYFFVEQSPVGIGLYTSTDFHTFTPVSLIISGTYQGPTVPVLIDGTWYMWVGTNVGIGSQQFGIQRWSAPSITGTWANSEVGYDFLPQTADEGVNTPYAQVVDPFVVQVNNSVYLYYSANQGTAALPQKHQVIKLAVANMTMSCLVQSAGGGVASTNLGGLLGWDFETNAVDFRRRDIGNLGSIVGNSPSTLSLLTLENTNTTSNTTREVELDFVGRDTTGNKKTVASIMARVDQINANDGSLHFGTRNGNAFYPDRMVIDTNGHLRVAEVPEYTDNAAAVAAGLSAGTFYRTGDVSKVVH